MQTDFGHDVTLQLASLHLVHACGSIGGHYPEFREHKQAASAAGTMCAAEMRQLEDGSASSMCVGFGVFLLSSES